MRVTRLMLPPWILGGTNKGARETARAFISYKISDTFAWIIFVRTSPSFKDLLIRERLTIVTRQVINVKRFVRLSLFASSIESNDFDRRRETRGISETKRELANELIELIAFV